MRAASRALLFSTALLAPAIAHAQVAQVGPGPVLPLGVTIGTTAIPNGGTASTIAGALTFSGAQTNSANGAASTPPLTFTGTVFTGGTATTTFPHLLFQPTGTTAVTSWNTNGTLLGFNTASGFNGNVIDLHMNGGATVFKLSNNGNMTAVQGIFTGGILVSASQPLNAGKTTDPGTAAGAAICKTYWVAGTVGSSGKMIAYCGTSTTPTTIVDNVGSGF